MLARDESVGPRVRPWVLTMVAVAAAVATAAAVLFGAWPRDIDAAGHVWRISLEAYHYPQGMETGVRVAYERRFELTRPAGTTAGRAAADAWVGTWPTDVSREWAGLRTYV